MDKSYYFNDKNVLAENEQYLLKKQLSRTKKFIIIYFLKYL